MKHRLVKQLKSENKRLKAKIELLGKMMIANRTNDCPVCGGVSDATINQLKEKMLNKCH